MDKKYIREYVKLKYPSRFKKGIRSVINRKGFTEVWSKGGEVIYFSETFMKEFQEYLEDEEIKS